MPNARHTLKQAQDRKRFKDALKALPIKQWVEKTEQYCEYRLDGQVEGGWLRAKQFTNGTLYLEASDDQLITRMNALLASTVQATTPQSSTPTSKLALPLIKAPNNPSIKLSNSVKPGTAAIKTNISAKTNIRTMQSASGIIQLEGAYVGTDESGKGDYFGSLVVAGVYVTEENAQNLCQQGVMDSKKLKDSRISELYESIVHTVGIHAIAVCELPPDQYNARYLEFQRKGLNLNHLLGSGHAKVLETLFAAFPDCHQAIIDQFADERYLSSQLEEKAKAAILYQTPRAEANVGVAAASIVARYYFVQRMERLAERFEMTLPLGAGPIVKTAARQLIQRYGRDVLPDAVKCHFKTTQEL